MARNRLTKEKAVKAVKMVHEGKPSTEIMEAAGYAPTVAIRGIPTLEKNPVYQEAKSEFMAVLEARHPQLKEKVADQIARGIEANRAISAIVQAGKDPMDASGATTDFIEVPDHATRHKYVTTALQLYGELDDRKPPAGNTFNIAVLVGLVRQAEQERKLKPV